MKYFTKEFIRTPLPVSPPLLSFSVRPCSCRGSEGSGVGYRDASLLKMFHIRYDGPWVIHEITGLPTIMIRIVVIENYPTCSINPSNNNCGKLFLSPSNRATRLKIGKSFTCALKSHRSYMYIILIFENLTLLRCRRRHKSCR